MRNQVCSTLAHLHDILNCCLTGVDYTDPRSLAGGGVVQFIPALGLVSSSLIIPIPSDNIAEGTEYFGLSFVALTNGDELGITPVNPTMAIVAINDTTGECPLPGVGPVYCLLASKYPTKPLLVSGNFNTMCSVTQLIVQSSTSLSGSSILFIYPVLHLVYICCYRNLSEVHFFQL